MLWLHMRVRICKKPFVDVVVLCSGNKKQTKKQDCGIQLSSPSRIIECRVLLAGCSYSLAMQSLVISYAPTINKNNKKRNATQRNGVGARKRLRLQKVQPILLRCDSPFHTLSREPATAWQATSSL